MADSAEKSANAATEYSPAQDGSFTPEAGADQEDTNPPWNASATSIARVLSCFWSFIVMGANDAAYGVSLVEPVADLD